MAWVLYQFWPGGLNMLWLINPDAEAYTSVFYYYSCALFLITTIAGFFLAIYEYCLKEREERYVNDDCGGGNCNGCSGCSGEGVLLMLVIALVLFIIMGIFAGVIMFIGWMGRLSREYYKDVMEQKELLEKYVLDLDTLEVDLLDPLLQDGIPVKDLRGIVMGYLHG